MKIQMGILKDKYQNSISFFVFGNYKHINSDKMSILAVDDKNKNSNNLKLLKRLK